MTASILVPIPADVIGNSPHTVRVVSNGVRAEEGGVLAAKSFQYYLTRYASLGYSKAEKESVNGDGVRVVETLFEQGGIGTVWHFRTTYYTRVPCARCADRWAQAYTVIDQDGMSTKPEPLCGDHLGMAETRVRRARDAGIELTLHRSEPLHIGQH